MKGNSQGEMFSAYYGYSDDLKRTGNVYGIPTSELYNNNVCGAICVRAQAISNIANGTKVGEIKCIWYVKYSARRPV